MFTIGDFAALGRVSVRMLRHYDAIGLLRPAHVDPATSYRYYRAEQLDALNRIVALKELGFGLQQVGEILHERVSGAQLRGMLRLRRAELEAVLAETGARLAAVEARLRTIESETTVPDIVIKSLPPVRVAELTGTCPNFDPRTLAPVVDGLYAALRRQLEAAGAPVIGPAVTRYADVPGGVDVAGSGAVLVHAGLPVGIGDVEGARTVELAGVERAATIVHNGPLDDVLPTVQALARWLGANGHGFGPEGAREVALDRPADPARWVTELQVPLGS
ncbi:MerR family transcriptional regulator [Pseudonocardia sp. GCM10023141]|uniref:MerR family transcriptional regulator n=1 Tax=Pseudonocardia sp. GCM10023141 TaxID=3252653 RepID=UPI003617CAC2